MVRSPQKYTLPSTSSAREAPNEANFQMIQTMGFPQDDWIAFDDSVSEFGQVCSELNTRATV